MTAAATVNPNLGRDRISSFLRKYLIVFIFLGMCALLAAFSPDHSFLRPQNLINVVRQISVIGLLALGVMLAIITLGITSKTLPLPEVLLAFEKTVLPRL